MNTSAKKERKKELNTKGILILVAISLLVVPLVYWFIDWKVGFALLLILPWIAYWRFIPLKFFRVFLYAYLIYAIAFVSATWIQIQLAQNPQVISFIEDHDLVSFFLGGEHAFAKQVLFSIVAGILFGLLAVNIPLLAIMAVSSEWVLALHETYGIGRRAAIRYLWSLILGIQYPWLAVDEGKVSESKPQGVLPEVGGPGVAVIRPGNVVVFERAGEISQVAAPGQVSLQRYERIRRIIQLKPMSNTQVLENVLTKDRIPLRVTFSVGFQIELKTNSDKRPESYLPPDGVALTSVLSDGIYSVYEGSIRKAVFNTASDWTSASIGSAENLLRDIIATYSFDQIFRKKDETDHTDAPGRFDPEERTIREIEEAIIDRHRTMASSWGVWTRSADIKVIELPAAVQEQMLNWWKAGWRRRVVLAEAEADKHAAITRGEGVAEALSTREYARAEAQTRMILAIAHGFANMTAADREALLGLRFLEALEKVAEDPATKVLLPANFSFGQLELASLLPEPGSGKGSSESPSDRAESES